MTSTTTSTTKTVTIFRGRPGSGKTTAATKYLGGETPCEADTFFVKGGKFCYVGYKVPEAHKWCQSECRRKMEAETEKIAVSNTFVKLWEMKPYVEMAQEFGYEIRFVEIVATNSADRELDAFDLSKRTQNSGHNVPEKAITDMKYKWEKTLPSTDDMIEAVLKSSIPPSIRK